MTITQAILAQRLKEARERTQVTKEQATQALGLQQAVITHIEAGSRSISTVELAALAKRYNRSIASFFAEGETAAQDDAPSALCGLDEAIALDNESACQIACMAVEAYRREEISRGKLLEINAMLGFSGDTLLSLAKTAF